MVQMINRLGRWRRLWVMAGVVWTLVAMASGWLNLPRAPQVPHDPLFLSRLSNEATSIRLGNYVKPKPVRGALVWSESPKFVRMANDMLMAFPATTTDERAAVVANEYRDLLNIEADRQRWPYVMEMLGIWLAPIALLLIAGMAVRASAGENKLASNRNVENDPSRPSGESASHDMHFKSIENYSALCSPTNGNAPAGR